jgi:hypothetical protein
MTGISGEAGLVAVASATRKSPISSVVDPEASPAPALGWTS